MIHRADIPPLIIRNLCTKRADQGFPVISDNLTGMANGKVFNPGTTIKQWCLTGNDLFKDG
jgi:hypothetical protein